MKIHSIRFRLALGLMGMAILAAVAFAQQTRGEKLPAEQALAELPDNSAELDRLEAVMQGYRSRIATAQAEIDILRAQLNKALLPSEPDRAQLRQIIQKSLGFEAEIRYAELERQLDLRAILGERRWARLAQVLKLYREQQKAGVMSLERLLQRDPQRQRVLEILRELSR